MSNSVYLSEGPRYKDFFTDKLVEILERGGTQPFSRFFAALELAYRGEYSALHELTNSQDYSTRINAYKALMWKDKAIENELLQMLERETRRFVFYEIERHVKWIRKATQ